MDANDIAKDVRDLKRKLAVRVNDYGTHIIAVAISRSPFANETLRISTALGEPICHIVHDIVRDCYLIEGVSYLDLGEIPVSAMITMDDIYGWETIAPLPTAVVKKYLDSTQKAEFDKWRQRFRNRDYTIQFLQLRNVF